MAAHDDAAVREPDRWERLWHGVFFVAVAVPTVIALTRPTMAARERLLTGALAVAFALWHWLLPVRHPEVAPGRRTLLYLVGAGVLTLALVGRDDAFTFLIYGLYPQMFMLLGRWGVAGAVAVTLLVFPRAGVFGDDMSLGTVISIAGSTALAATLGVFILAVTTQSEQRRAALEQLAAARSDLADASRRAGVLEERQRMAAEIHDTVAQSLSSIVMLLEAAEQDLSTDTTTAHGHIDQARRTARESLADVRRSVLALRPEVLEHASLPGALAVVVQRWSERTGISSDVRVLGDAYPLPPDTELTLLRTAQEALTNIAKHAEATKATVTLSFAAEEAMLDIRDNGRGFDPRVDRADPELGGFGLGALRQRVARVGGRLAVVSRPTAGTVVVAAVPRSTREE